MINTKNIVTATKWSAFAELIAKIISPATNIILARLLTPEMFGIVVTVTLVISFADIFSDAGFQRYIIQHEFDNKKALDQSSNVAFSAHLIISLFIWLIIIIFSDPIASLVGSPGCGLAIIVSCISLPIAALSSIQMALFKRDLDFKRLFKVRLAGVLTPFFVTVPLAFFLRSFWALIIGTIISNIVITVSLTISSEWKPKFLIDLQVLKEMFSFSMWTLLEAVLTWLTSYVDIMVLSSVLTAYYIGVYKTAMVTANQVLSIITATTNSVLFSSLSRVQNNNEELGKVFYSYQRLVSYIVIPLGAGIFAYRGLVTQILLGSQWGEAAGFVGLWGLVGGLYLVMGGYASELYRAIGKPKVSALAQALYIVVIVTSLMLMINESFETQYTVRTLSRIIFILIHFALLKIFTSISPLQMLKNVMPAILGASAICIGAFIFQGNIETSIWIEILSIVLSILVCLIVLLVLPMSRTDIVEITHKYLIKK